MEQVTVGGVKLEVRRIGALRPGVPTLVFLHEALGSVSLWRDFPARLAARLQLPALLYSRRGHGHSAPLELPRAFSYLEDEARPLAELLRREGVERPVLYGHSDGASIALAHAAAAPVEALILEAPHVFVEPRTQRAVANVARSWVETGLRERLERHHGANTEPLFRAWADTWTHPGFASWSIEPLLERVTAPTLMLQGLDDPYTGVVQLERIEARVHGRVERRLVEGGGHVLHRESPAEVIDAACAFLASLGVGRA